MKELILLSGVLFLAFVSCPIVEAASYSKPLHLRRTQKNPSRNIVKTQSPSARQLENRCPPRNNKKVWIKPLNSTIPPQEYPYLETKGAYLYYCVGEMERAKAIDALAEIHFEPPVPPVPLRAPIVKAIPSACQPATRRVRAAIVFNPIAFDPMMDQGREFTETVLLNIDFQADEKIGKIDVLSKSHPLLVESAKRAAQKILFIPAQENGRNVCVTQQYAFDFLKRTAFRKQSITLLSPVRYESLSNGQHRIRLAWLPVKNADTYFPEVQYKTSPNSYDWQPFRMVRTIITNSEIISPGSGPVRWRVTAKLLDGTEAYSQWQEFTVIK